MHTIRTHLADARARARARRDDGFTLIELLVVVIVIGILAAIAIPVYISAQQSGYDAAIKSDLTSAKKAEVMYFEKNDAWTTSLTDLTDYGYRTSASVTGTTVQLVAASRGSFCIHAGSKGSAPRWHIDGNTGAATGSC